MADPSATHPEGAAPQAALDLDGHPPFSVEEQRFLLGLARRALAGAHIDGLLPDSAEVPSSLCSKRACFVTLHKGAALRGCIGQVRPRYPLYLAVWENARGAALRDLRFDSVQPEEVGQIHIEISVLTAPRPLNAASPEAVLDQLHPPHDGVLFELAGRCATFLPQVWAQLPDKTEFLNRLAQKAGFPPSAWRNQTAEISVYRAQAFESS